VHVAARDVDEEQPLSRGVPDGTFAECGPNIQRDVNLHVGAAAERAVA
jgi:hypothetical protein